MKLFKKKSEKPLSSLIFLGLVNHICDLIFINWKTVGFISIIIILNFGFFAPKDLVFCFPKLDIQISIIETLSRIVSIFLGLIFSLIILSFNIFNKYFGRFAFNVLFKNKTIKFLFTLFICTLSFLIYSLSYLNSIKSPDLYSQSLFILSITFSVVIVFSIFPVANSLLKNSQNRTNINDIVGKLNGGFEDVEFTLSAPSDFQITSSPIITLIEIGTISIKDYDYTTIGILIAGIENNFKKILDKNNEDLILKGLYRQSNHILTNLLPIAAKERNENALIKIVNARFNIEKHTIANIEKIKLHDFANKYQGWDFNNTFQDFFNRTNQFNEDAVCKIIIDRYRDFLTEIITVYMPGRFDYDSANWQKHVNESGMLTNLFGDINKYTSMIFSSKKFHLYQNISNIFSTLELNIISSTNTTMTKVFMLQVCNSWKYDSFENYLVNSNVSQVEMLNYPFGTLGTTQTLTEIKCDIPFLYTLKSIDLLFAQNKLNTMAINSLKALAFFLINNIGTLDLSKKLLLISINEFKLLGSYIKTTDSDYKKDIYIKLKKHLDYIDQHLTEKKIVDADISKSLQSAKDIFDNTELFKIELKEKGYISNDKIV